MTNPYRQLLVQGLVAGLLLAAATLGWAQKSSSKPPSKPKLGAKWTSPSDGLEMIWIPPGEFLMGSPTSEAGRNTLGSVWDEAQHRVKIAKGFWMDATEVTNEAYRKFLLANPSWQKDRIDPKLHADIYLIKWTGTDYPVGKGNYPVVTVSWYAAGAYCGWAGGRLPTEAEWEYAARAGTTTAYWWGDTFDASRALAGTDKKVFKEPEAVGNPRHMNPWGLYDMPGNALEWTSSLGTPYPYRGDDGRESPNNTTDRFPCGDKSPPEWKSCRSARGGSYFNGPNWVRSAARLGEDPTFSSYRNGLRCVR